jgi:4-amino-4-deoxy-L-arabinose transferase-like glycosyltransferase
MRDSVLEPPPGGRVPTPAPVAPGPSRRPSRPALRGRRLRWTAAAALLLLAAALALRLGYVEATPDYGLRHDARDYDVHARSIAQGEGYSKTLAYGRPTAFRPPGYPYFLAGVYRLAGVERADTRRRVHAARVAQAVVGTVAVGLVGLLAAQLWGAGVALAATGLAAAYLPLILVGGSVMSEPLFVMLMLAALVAAVQHRRSAHRLRFAVLAGVLAGLAILTRANAVVLLLPLAAAVWDGGPRLARRALAAPAALLAAAALTVAPWTIRNAIELESFVPVSTQLGSAMAGTYNDAARNDRENPASWRSLRWVPDYAELFRRVRGLPEATLERELRKAAVRYAREHPGYVAEVAWWSTLRTLELAGHDRSRATAATISIDHRWADRGIVCFWVFALLAVAGAVTRPARTAPRFVWAIPALLFLSVAFLVVETPRYRAAIDPFVILLAALAVTAAARVVRERLPARLTTS